MTQQFNPNDVVSHDLGRPLEIDGGHSAEMYWTEDRMAAAQPVDLPVDVHGDAEGMEGLGEQGLNAPDNAGLDVVELHGLAPRFETALVQSTDRFPYAAIGKLFARVAGVDRAGTAFVVGKRGIATAGHCVFADGARQWVSDVAFAPGYVGRAPHGLWTARSLHTLAGWTAQGADARMYDLGGALLDRPIQNVTGAIGWLANIQPSTGSFHSVGYPRQWAAPQHPFDGTRMWRCIGQQLSSASGLKMANNMTEGASGGPWLIERDRAIYANGLNSFRRSDEPESLCSPYFGDGFANLMAILKG